MKGALQLYETKLSVELKMEKVKLQLHTKWNEMESMNVSLP